MVHFYQKTYGFLTFSWGIDLKCITEPNWVKSSRPEVFLGNSALKIAANLQEKTHAEVRLQ